MENLKRIKEDLICALITLGENKLSDKEKIKECDKIIIETIKFIDILIKKQEKEELFIEIAYKLLMKIHNTAGVIQSEYRDGNVWFEFHITSNDYSAGRDCDIISKYDIEKNLAINKN